MPCPPETPSKHSLNAPGQPRDNGRCFQKANWHPRTPPLTAETCLQTTRLLNGQLIVYADGSASAGTKDGGAGVIVTRGHPADPTILHQSHLRGAAFTSLFGGETAAMQLALEWVTANHPEYSVTICTDCQPLQYFIKRSFTCLTKEIFVPPYSALVRLHLEYAAQANCPYLKKGINHLERIQRAAKRWVKSLGGLTYEEQLQTLKLQPLGKRRLRNDLVLTHKILHNHIDQDATQLLKFSRRPGLRRSSIRLLHQTGRTRRRRNSFACRVVNNWNRLPFTVTSVTEQRKFKQLLDSYIYS